MNYYQQYLETVKEVKGRPKLLLHVCCGVCVMYPIRELSRFFEVTVYFSNSNVYPFDEYQKRLLELKRYLEENQIIVKVIVDDYDYDSFYKQLEPYKARKERQERCTICFSLRLQRAYQYAKQNDYAYLTTTLTVSRFKDSKQINQVAQSIQEQYPTVKYLYSDFKKGGGYEIANRLHHESDIYTQKYCGCQFSIKTL